MIRYTVVLKHSEEGFSVWCPSSPGCCSQGYTERLGAAANNRAGFGSAVSRPMAVRIVPRCGKRTFSPVPEPLNSTILVARTRFKLGVQRKKSWKTFARPSASTWKSEENCFPTKKPGKSKSGCKAEPKLSGIRYHEAIRAFQKAGFRIIRQGRHAVMSNGVKIITIPRHNPVNACTRGTLVVNAGLDIEEFKAL